MAAGGKGEEGRDWGLGAGGWKSPATASRGRNDRGGRVRRTTRALSARGVPRIISWLQPWQFPTSVRKAGSHGALSYRPAVPHCEFGRSDRGFYRRGRDLPQGLLQLPGLLSGGPCPGGQPCDGSSGGPRGRSGGHSGAADGLHAGNAAESVPGGCAGLLPALPVLQYLGCQQHAAEFLGFGRQVAAVLSGRARESSVQNVRTMSVANVNCWLRWPSPKGSWPWLLTLPLYQSQRISGRMTRLGQGR